MEFAKLELQHLVYSKLGNLFFEMAINFSHLKTSEHLFDIHTYFNNRDIDVLTKMTILALK